jgi:hypothetical protein
MRGSFGSKVPDGGLDLRRVEHDDLYAPSRREVESLAGPPLAEDDAVVSRLLHGGDALVGEGRGEAEAVELEPLRVLRVVRVQDVERVLHARPKRHDARTGSIDQTLLSEIHRVVRRRNVVRVRREPDSATRHAGVEPAGLEHVEVARGNVVEPLRVPFSIHDLALPEPPLERGGVGHGGGVPAAHHQITVRYVGGSGDRSYRG